MDLIRLVQGNTTLVLHGAGKAVPHAGAVLGVSEPDAGGEVASQALTMVLEGPAGQIEGALAAVNRLLDEAARWQGTPGGPWVYLEARVTPGGEVWRSKILSGRVELLGAGADQRAGGSQGARVHLVRANWWEGAQAEVFTSSAQAGRSNAAKVISNLAGANYLHVDGADVAGDLPAPPVVRVVANGVGNNGADVLVCENLFSDPAGYPVYYQGEAGTVLAGSMQADYANLVLNNGTNETALWQIDLPGADLQKMGSRMLRFAMRLRSPVNAGNSLWHRWEVQYQIARAGSWTGIWTGKGGYLGGAGAGAQLVLGAAVAMPPWYVEPGVVFNEPVRLRLLMAADSAGAYTVELDWMALLPLDGWRLYTRFLPVANNAIVDDQARGVMYPGTDGIMQQHTAEGPGFWLHPGKPARFFYHVMGTGAGGYTTGQAVTVSLAYRPRRRTI